MADITMPVTALEFVSGSRVRVTAEFPITAAAGWTKVQFYMPSTAQPRIGQTVKVTLEVEP